MHCIRYCKCPGFDGRTNDTREKLVIKRALLFGLGVILIPLGLIGLVVPILPGVLFLIAAGVCFAATSPRLAAWSQSG